MILHLGSDFYVKTDHVIMILDYEEAVKNQDTSLFLEGVRQIKINKDVPKSIIITQEGEQRNGYLSPISARTLLKRSKKMGLDS